MNQRRVIVSIFLRWIMGIIFLGSGILKALDTKSFFLALLGYQLPVIDVILRLIAVIFPWIEICLGIGLLINIWPTTLRPLTFGCCCVFAAMLGQAWLRGLSIHCGCMGSVDGLFSTLPFAFIRAMILVAISIYLCNVISFFRPPK